MQIEADAEQRRLDHGLLFMDRLQDEFGDVSRSKKNGNVRVRSIIKNIKKKTRIWYKSNKKKENGKI